MAGMTFKQKYINFEISLTKLKFCPKHVSEVPEIISRAFEREIAMKEITPVIGTDHVKEWVLREDADIPEFYNAPNMMQEWIAEKLIRVRIPDGIIPKNFYPKKVKVLATGNKIAKFFGEDTCSTRTVETTLKLFDCGHFYLKQTLPGSGASPHWTIFEGRWNATERGLRLEHLLRYQWQVSRKPTMDFSLEATKKDFQTTLAWDGETEKQLNGNLPAVVGTDDLFWAELVREGCAQGDAKIRWNEECPEPPSWKRREDRPERRPDTPGAADGADDASDAADIVDGKPRQRRTSPPRPSSSSASTAASGTNAAAPASTSASSSSSAAPGGSAKKARAKAKVSEEEVEVEPDQEPALPLYIAAALVALLVAYFCYCSLLASAAVPPIDD